MYGLPSDTQLDFFKGKALLQACFGANDLIRNFHSSAEDAHQQQSAVILLRTVAGNCRQDCVKNLG
jgi:hypothetical protein